MSRCFPFPPPGYEKKARPDDADLLKKPDDADLLKKEKNREKKHKKEKRDKEKREGKEKREKDKSDGKQREKKDRKERHKEKKKDKEKDRDKDKEKASTSGEKSVAVQSESYNEEKLYQTEKERGKEKSSISDEKKPAVQFQGQNGDKPIRNSLRAEETEDTKFVQELGRRIRDEEKGKGSQLVERVTGTDRKKDEGMERFAFKDPGMLAEGKEKNKDKRVDKRKMDGQGIREEARFSGNAMVQNLAGVFENNVEGMPRPMEKNIERRMEGKEKSKEREDDKRGDKRKDKDREKKSHGKDKDREKEKKKEEKAKEKSEHKKTEPEKCKNSSKNDIFGAHNSKTSHLPRDCNQNAATEGNFKKRTDREMNGFLRDNDVRPNKMPRPTSSHHPLTENGRKLEPNQTPLLFTSDRQGAANNLKVDNKERKVNGITEAQLFSVSTTKPSSEITHADQIAYASMKPPHPDTKYLSQVLTVPIMEEWSDFDDQDWLFSSKDPPSKKPEMGSIGVNEELRVWAEARQIESADVCALPYVIPY